MLVPRLLIAMASALTPTAEETHSWVTFTSREGNFVVDLPARPTRTSTRLSRSRQGQVRVFVARCDVPGVHYLAEKVDLPQSTGLKPADVEAILDFWQDEMAGDFNGKV